MTWQPPISLTILIALAAVLLAVSLWSGWRSSALLGRNLRRGLLLSRSIGIAILILCLLNPGRWRAPDEEGARHWLLLLDRSASMAVEDGDPAGRSRWQAACALTEMLQDAAAERGVSLKWRPFARGLEPASSDAVAETDAVPDGEGSDLAAALSTGLAASGREELAGVIVLSDGRQTRDTPVEEAVLRARARQLPVHTVGFGGDVELEDLSVQVIRRQIMAFPGQEISLGAKVVARGLGDLRVPVRWLDEEGNELASETLDLSDGQAVTAGYKTLAPDSTTSYAVELPPWEGDQRPENNRETIRVRILSGKTRVFLAEGAPYWDSKFLAQLFRQQPFVDLLSIHRLSETRYFRIDSASAEPAVSSDAIFPETAEELSAFDLLVLGKGMETILDTGRVAMISDYVRNQGGAVLFARGRGYAGSFPALEALEPVTWAEGGIEAFHLRPDAEGEAAGLFGEALPARDDAIWATLPELQDARRIDSIKPFTRILARGVTASASRSLTTDRLGQVDAGFPLLMVRRYGLGVVGLVNADGLWKWDFFPEAKEAGNMYEEFWAQLIQWMASYSEFLPGHAYALRLGTTRMRAGETVYATAGWRPMGGGEGLPGTPVIHVTDAVSGESIRKVTPAILPGEDDRLRWRVGIETDRPGNWLLRLESAEGEALNGPETGLSILPPPGESENVNADPAFLENLAAATGGQSWTSEQALLELPEHLSTSSASQSGAVRWDPLWARWQLLLVAAAFFSLEWWWRRRAGLV